jgi:hypothetical protein
VNRVAQELPKKLSSNSCTGIGIDLAFFHIVEIVRREPTVIVSTYALRRDDDNSETMRPEHFCDLENHLGIGNESLYMTDRL